MSRPAFFYVLIGEFRGNQRRIFPKLFLFYYITYILICTCVPIYAYNLRFCNIVAYLIPYLCN